MVKYGSTKIIRARREIFSPCQKKTRFVIVNNKQRYYEEGSHRGLVRPPAKRGGGDELPHGFESHSLRHAKQN